MSITGPEGIQILVLSSPPFCLKIKPNNHLSQSEQLGRLNKFENFIKDYFTRYSPTPASCTGLDTKRQYFVKPQCTLDYKSCQDLFVRSLEVFGAHSRKKGFCYAIVSGGSAEDSQRVSNQSLPVGRVSTMARQAVDADLLASKSALILDFKSKQQNAAKLITFDTFLERIAVFENTFKDIFVRLDAPLDKKNTVRYTIRKDLCLPVNMERQVFAHSMHHCGLYKGSCFRLRSVGLKAQNEGPSKLGMPGRPAGPGLFDLLSALSS